MASMRTNIGRSLAKVLGIKLQERNPFQDEAAQGDSTLSLQTTRNFVEKEPKTNEFLAELLPSRFQIASYLWSLFPCLQWIDRYNLQVST